MKVKISDHLTYKNILKLTIMPVLMNVFMSLYSIVDGLCVSTFGSSDSFAGINLIMPVICIIGGIGFMFGNGGSALAGKYLGEGKQEKANQLFTSLVIVVFIIGTLFSIFGSFMIEPIARAMASVTPDSTEGMVNEAIKYGRILMLGQVAFMMQSLFQSFFLVAEKSYVGFRFTIGAGIINMVLDVIFIGVLKGGVVGAAIATIVGQLFGGIGPLIYFLNKRSGRFYLGKIHIDIKDLFRVAFNGSSEFVNNISSSIVGIVFNLQLLRYYGTIGVSAYGALMYLSMIFILIFVGFACGVAPATSYQYGAKNTKELSTILKRCSFVIVLLSIAMFCISEAISEPIGKLFSSGNEDIADLTTLAMRIYSFSFLLCGFGIYSSNFFTALNNGLISAIISFFRCLVFSIAFVYILPAIMHDGIGIWYSMVAAELGSFILSISFLIANKNKYHYFEKISLFKD